MRPFPLFPLVMGYILLSSFLTAECAVVMGSRIGMGSGSWGRGSGGSFGGMGRNSFSRSSGGGGGLPLNYYSGGGRWIEESEEEDTPTDKGYNNAFPMDSTTRRKARKPSYSYGFRGTKLN